jgi:uncharacterized protein DUF6527
MITKVSGPNVWLWCPGCQEVHGITDLWQFDGNTEQPTISPSILVQGGRQGSDHVCHSFVKAGRWEFLGDSTHALAGQTVDVVPFPEWFG